MMFAQASRFQTLEKGDEMIAPGFALIVTLYIVWYVAKPIFAVEKEEAAAEN